jgi:hypothetical protein
LQSEQLEMKMKMNILDLRSEQLEMKIFFFAACEMFQEQFDGDPFVDKMEECRAMLSPE